MWTNLLYFLYITSEVNSTISYCIYHTDLAIGQNAVFHNFSRQIALSQYSGRSIACFQRDHSKISKITYMASRFLLFEKRQICSASWGRVFVWTLNGLLEFQDYVFFLFNGFITMCNLKKGLIRESFWVLLQPMFMNNWKQTARRLKLQERLLTINKEYNSVKHLQRQQDKYESVSKNLESFKLKA